MEWECGPYHGLSELVIAMKSTDYIDILDQNLLDSVGNMFGDVMIQFIFQYDNAQVYITRYV